MWNWSDGISHNSHFAHISLLSLVAQCSAVRCIYQIKYSCQFLIRRLLSNTCLSFPSKAKGLGSSPLHFIWEFKDSGRQNKRCHFVGILGSKSCWGIISSCGWNLAALASILFGISFSTTEQTWAWLREHNCPRPWDGWPRGLMGWWLPGQLELDGEHLVHRRDI